MSYIILQLTPFREPEIDLHLQPIIMETNVWIEQLAVISKNKFSEMIEAIME